MTTGNSFEENLPRLISRAQFAELLAVSKRTFDRLRSQGRIPEPVDLPGPPRFDREVVMDWLKQGCPPLEFDQR